MAFKTVSASRRTVITSCETEIGRVGVTAIRTTESGSLNWFAIGREHVLFVMLPFQPLDILGLPASPAATLWEEELSQWFWEMALTLPSTKPRKMSPMAWEWSSTGRDGKEGPVLLLGGCQPGPATQPLGGSLSLSADCFSSHRPGLGAPCTACRALLPLTPSVGWAPGS